MRGAAAFLFLGSGIVAGAFGACVDFGAVDPVGGAPDGASADAADAPLGDAPSDGPTQPDGLAPSAPLIGPVGNGSRDDYLGAGRAQAFRTTATRSGAARRVRVFIRDGNVAARAVVGVYDEKAERANQLLASATVVTDKAGWSEGPLTSALTVEGGAVYWVALLNPESNAPNQLLFRSTDAANGGGPAYDLDAVGLDALPMEWSSAATNFRNAPVAVQILE